MGFDSLKMEMIAWVLLLQHLQIGDERQLILFLTKYMRLTGEEGYFRYKNNNFICCRKWTKKSKGKKIARNINDQDGAKTKYQSQTKLKITPRFE